MDKEQADKLYRQSKRVILLSNISIAISLTAIGICIAINAGWVS